MEVYQPLQGRDCRLEKLQGLAVPYLNKQKYYEKSDVLERLK